MSSARSWPITASTCCCSTTAATAGATFPGVACDAPTLCSTHARFDYLLTRDDVDTGRIGLLGYSLGGNIGLAFAAVEPRITGVVTLSTFARWREVAADHGGPLGRALISDGLDAAETVAGLGDRPYMIVHGDRDDVVLFRHAAILEQSARGAGISVTRIDVEGAHHLNVTAKPATQHAIAEFFARTPERREE